MEFLILRFPARQPDHADPEALLVQRMISYITLNLSRPFRTADLCTQIGVSRSHASRIFSRVCGLPMKDYIWQMRETEACRLLRDTDLSVVDIASRTGYEDPVYFSRIFRLKTGLTPTDYRKGRRINPRTGELIDPNPPEPGASQRLHDHSAPIIKS